MSNSLFEFTDKLPQVGDEITVFSTKQPKELREKNIKNTAKALAKIFGLKGKLIDGGDRFILSEKAKRIALYTASDSFWYQDEDLFASEDKKLAKHLPSDKVAKETAVKFLESNKLLLPGASVYSSSFTTVAVNKAGSDKVDEYNTEIHVNFRYTIDKLPVFGPGAKTRVSFVDVKNTSGVYHFWRNAEPQKEKRKLLNPELALEIFYKNFRFSQLQNTDLAKVTIKTIELGYFAMPPTDVQNYLIPVYRIRGTISTKELPKYDFDHYIVAIKYDESDVKSMGISIKGMKAMVF
jgi:regulatory protein YycI of two-component signal transduction system YycFG